MAIAMRMPQHRKMVTYALSGQEVTQVGRYHPRHTDSRPQSQILIEYSDRAQCQKGAIAVRLQVQFSQDVMSIDIETGQAVSSKSVRSTSGVQSNTIRFLGESAFFSLPEVAGPTAIWDRSHLDLPNTSQGRQMDEELFWSAYARAASVPRLDKAATLIALEQLKTLAPNWSGYSASPIDRRVIQTAKEVVWALPSDIIETPKVVPMTRGRLQFEWHRGNRSLELEFADGDQIHYLKWDPDAGIEEEDVIPVNDVAMIHSLLRWFEAEPGDG